MNRRTTTRRSLASAVAVLSVLVAGAGPASAHNGDDHTTPPRPGAYTSQAQVVEGNLHDLPVGPLTVATWPIGPSHAVLTGSQHIVDFGVLESNAAGSYEDGWVTADAEVARVTGSIQGLISVELEAISAECRSDAGGQTGSASIAGGKIRIAGYGVIKIPINPAPNTYLGIPGLLDITLNKQVVHPDGSISVTALDIHGSQLLQGLLLTMHPLYLTIAQATCDQIVPPLEIPVASALGLVGPGFVVVVLATGAFLVIRRRREEGLQEALGS